MFGLEGDATQSEAAMALYICSYRPNNVGQIEPIDACRHKAALCKGPGWPVRPAQAQFRLRGRTARNVIGGGSTMDKHPAHPCHIAQMHFD